MLVLSRKTSQSIQIGDSITVRVVRIDGNKVRLGIEAPPHVRIMRDDAGCLEPPNREEESESSLYLTCCAE